MSFPSSFKLPLTWVWKKGTDLNPSELYTLLALRQNIFIVEQKCFYLDADGLDFEAYHLLGYEQNQSLVAYLRVYQPHQDQKTLWKIGRVLVDPTLRGKKIGFQLVRQALFYLGQSQDLHQNPTQTLTVCLHAQAHLDQFYHRLGWKTDGPIFDEAGIPHLPMKRTLSYQNRPSFDSKNREFHPTLLPPPVYSLHESSSLKHLIFDLDGTLIDSSKDYALCFDKLAQDFNRPKPDHRLIRSLMYAGLLAQLDACIGPRDDAFEVKVIQHFRTVCMEHQLQHTCLYPQVLDLLKGLKKKGFRLHICTNRPQDLALDVLERLKIKSYFDLCIGGDTGLERKPNPEMLITLLKNLEISAHQALFVGDSIVDISAGSRADLYTCAVSWGYTPLKLLQDHQPSALLHTPLDLLSLLDSSSQ